MIKILHTGDWQLGMRQYGFVQRELDMYAAAYAVADIAIERKVDAVILAGDNFDAVRPQSAAVVCLSSIVKSLRKAGINHVIGIDGNHDACDSGWLTVCDITPAGGDNVITITDKDDSGLSLRIIGIDNCRRTEFYNKLNYFIESGIKAEIMIIHQALSELCGFPTTEHSAADMAPLLHKIGVKYVAMGDIHTYSETVIAGIRFAYPGSIEVTATDEPPTKSVNIVTWDGTTISTEIVNISTRPFYHIELESESDLNDLTAKIAAAQGEPIVELSYAASNKELAVRAVELLDQRNIMYKLRAYYDGTAVAKEVSEEAMDVPVATRLRNVVEAYFDVNTDQYELTTQLIKNPDRTTAIITDYLDNHAVTTKG